MNNRRGSSILVWLQYNKKICKLEHIVMGAQPQLLVLWISVQLPKMLTIIWSPFDVKDGGWCDGQTVIC
jgi:hypothetical protein